MKAKRERMSTCLQSPASEELAARKLKPNSSNTMGAAELVIMATSPLRQMEVDADTAHNIGVALTKGMGRPLLVPEDHHCHTGHYHNHFVINSVIRCGRQEVLQLPEDYRRMREVSDRLCRRSKEYPCWIIRISAAKLRRMVCRKERKNRHSAEKCAKTLTERLPRQRPSVTLSVS